MKVYFMFKPCKGEESYKLVPHGKVDRERLISVICKKLKGRVVADTHFLSIISAEEAKISVSKKCEIIIREVKNEEKAREIAKVIGGELLQ